VDLIHWKFSSLCIIPKYKIHWKFSSLEVPGLNPQNRTPVAGWAFGDRP
jgi:hypothetical protein